MEEFIAKLTGADESFIKILKADGENLVIQGDERDRLKKLQAANAKILAKLKSGEFTVAIVGLENSGKSSLGNALINLMALPSDSERCTFTTTEIRSGNTDAAEVYFYSREKFLENFRQMLGAAEYPDADKVNLADITTEDFNSHWDAVAANPAKQNLYKAHNTKTAEDIKTILAHKKTVNDLVGSGMKSFGQEFMNDNSIDNEFKRHITGIVNAKTHQRDAHPYAVEKIIIRSTLLADMEDIVLYDVPGFNSPTQMHRTQTKEMLREADAIIFVTNVVENPNLDSTQLDMLLDTDQDEYSVEVSEKSFVFGNKIDRANNPDVARNNLATLTNEAVVKNKITREGRVIGGSALAYLEGKNFERGTVAVDSLKNLGIASDGVNILRDMIRAYYNNERYEALHNRATSILDDTRGLLEALLKANATTSNLDEQTQSAMGISMEIATSLPKKFKAESDRITQEYAKDIFVKNPFTEELKKSVEAVYPLTAEAPAQHLEDAKHEGGLDPDGIYPTVLIDVYLRQKFSIMFLDNISERVKNLNTEKHGALRRKLIDAFLTSAGIENPNSNRTELEKSANELFDGMLVEGGEDCNFNTLVERHVMTLIQTLIKYPFASEDRYRKVEKTLEELLALAVFYGVPTDKNVFFARILAHDDSNLQDAAKLDEIFLRQFFEYNREAINRGNPVDIENLPFEDWAKFVTADNRQTIADALQDKFNGKHWDTIRDDQKILRIQGVFQNLSTAQENIPAQPTEPPQKDSGSLKDKLITLHERARKFHSMYGEEAMIATLDADIEILRDVTKRAILPAIGMERTFNSVITKNVSFICDRLQAHDGNTAFLKWITTNAEKLKPSRFREIQKNIARRKKKEDIVAAIQVLFDAWDKW